MTNSSPDLFQWHPDYAGQSFDGVERGLIDSIRRDQTAYHAALDSAEREEFGAFNTVRDIEKRWSNFDFGWAEIAPETLAKKIVQFERAREAKRELFSWEQWRGTAQPTESVTNIGEVSGDWRENLSDEQRRKLASAIAIGIIVAAFLLFVLLLAFIV